jgi:hypothetical protein
VDTSEDPQCYVFRACYSDFVYPDHYSNEIYASPQQDGSLYWTYVSCYQVPPPSKLLLLLLSSKYQFTAINHKAHKLNNRKNESAHRVYHTPRDTEDTACGFIFDSSLSVLSSFRVSTSSYLVQTVDRFRIAQSYISFCRLVYY